MISSLIFVPLAQNSLLKCRFLHQLLLPNQQLIEISNLSNYRNKFFIYPQQACLICCFPFPVMKYKNVESSLSSFTFHIHFLWNDCRFSTCIKFNPTISQHLHCYHPGLSHYHLLPAKITAGVISSFPCLPFYSSSYTAARVIFLKFDRLCHSSA